MAVGDWLSGKLKPPHALFSCGLHHDNYQMHQEKIDWRAASYFFGSRKNLFTDLNFKAKLKKTPQPN